MIANPETSPSERALALWWVMHILWDSNVMRSPALAGVDKHATQFVKMHPRSNFPELEANPVDEPGAFEALARAGHQVAIDWAYDIETTADPV